MAERLAQCRMVKEQAKKAFKISSTAGGKRGVKSKHEILRRNQAAAAAARYARDEYTKALEGAVSASETERDIYAYRAVTGRARRDALAAEVLRMKEELGIAEDEANDETCDTKKFLALYGIEMSAFAESLLRWPTCAAL